MNYGQILSDSWSFLWKNKILWVFGFLAALGAGGSGGGSGGGGQFQTGAGERGEPSPETIRRFEEIFEAIERGDFAAIPNGVAALTGLSVTILLFIIVALFVLGIVLWVVGLLARVGLISAVVAERQERAITWQLMTTDGPRYFWQVLGLKLLLYGIPLILFFSFFAVTFGSLILTLIRTGGDFNTPPPIFGVLPFMICGFVCIGIPAMIAIQVVDGFAFRSIVIDQMGIIDGIKNGWRVGWGNLGPTIVLGLIFIAIGIAMAIALAIVFLIPMGLFAALSENGGIGFFAMLGIGFLFSMLVAAVLNGIYLAFQSIAFSKAYLEFTGKHFEQETFQETV